MPGLHGAGMSLQLETGKFSRPVGTCPPSSYLCIGLASMVNDQICFSSHLCCSVIFKQKRFIHGKKDSASGQGEAHIF